jgi:hypothetical protein
MFSRKPGLNMPFHGTIHLPVENSNRRTRERDGARGGLSHPVPRGLSIGEQQCGIGQQLATRRGQLRARAIAGEQLGV